MVSKLFIKWNGNKYDFNVNEDSTVENLFVLITAATGVPKNRLKLIPENLELIQLEQDEDIALPDDDTEEVAPPLRINSKTMKEIGISNNHNILAIGALSTEIDVAEEKTKFIEDLTTEEKAKLYDKSESKLLPTGIENLGVTCYFNSVIQALTPIQKLIDDFVTLGSERAISYPFFGLLSKLLLQLRANESPPTPIGLINILRKEYPQFAKKTTHASLGESFQQQDAMEMFDVLFQIYSTAGGKVDLFKFNVETQCIFDPQTDEEKEYDIPTTISHDEKAKLEIVCSTDNNDIINNIHQGTEKALDSSLEKRPANEEITTNLKFKTITRIMDLPEYLVTQFVRFQWKSNSDGGVRAKITKKIAFTETYDSYNFCNEDLKAVLQPARYCHADLDKIKTEEEKKDEEEEVADDDMEEFKDGNYELVSIVTHQGRTADVGHYICYKKLEDGKWAQMDDATVQTYKWTELDLAGGRPDHHIAYICVWKQKTVTLSRKRYEAAKKKLEEQKIELDELLLKKAEREAL